MKETFSWKKIVLEALMIVLSVLLALFINEWNNTKNEQNETDVMMKHIIAEMGDNKAFIEKLLPYQKSVFEKIQEVAMGDSLAATFLKNGYFEMYEIAPRGVIQGEIQSIAWSIAKEEKIANRISFNESKLLFSAYEQQLRVLRTIERIIHLLGSREIHREELIEESIIVLAVEWNEMISQEEELLHRYSKALQKIKRR